VDEKMVEAVCNKFWTLLYWQMPTILKSDTWRCQLPEAIIPVIFTNSKIIISMRDCSFKK
jgi:hypothetical protein